MTLQERQEQLEAIWEHVDTGSRDEPYDNGYLDDEQDFDTNDSPHKFVAE